MEVIKHHEAGKFEGGKVHFQYVQYIVRYDGKYYSGKWKDRKHPPTEFAQLENVVPISIEDGGPAPKANWTIVSHDNDCYLKQPNIEEYLDTRLQSRMEHEIEMCELLKHHHHPNLAVYYGCTQQQGNVSGLLFKRYKQTLTERVNPQRLSKRNFIAGGRPLVEGHMRNWLDSLRSALNHLHSLGIVHNDLTPSNIMLDRNDQPIIIDFGSACRMGESLQHVKRTPGWYDETIACAAGQNDLDALKELETWLFGSENHLRYAT